jgi:predicted flap endonuclease-1-like 5' DNA nuclease
MESSRRQYEEDAKRYREQAGQYEKHSETLRLQLDEVEKHFADMEIQQRQALKEARAATANPSSNGKTPPEPETETGPDPDPDPDPDNLQEIVGIGRVFEQTLRGLGIVSFEQIANLDRIEFAQLNEELKEFKGRVEQDDWVGQAKDLYLKKYGAAN